MMLFVQIWGENIKMKNSKKIKKTHPDSDKAK